MRTIEAMIKANTGQVIFSLIPNATGFARVPESLLLIFAVSVMEDALKCLASEGVFRARRHELGALMKASKDALRWQDYNEIEQVRLRRNKVAHQRVFLKDGQCRQDLSAIATELLAWKILTTDFKGHYGVTMGGDA